MSTIDERFAQTHAGSARIAEAGRQSFPDGVTHDSRWITPFPIYMTGAEGAYKWDVDGNRYLDYVVGHGAVILGHSHPAIVDAVKQQMEKGTHLGGSTELEISWAKAIMGLVPCAERVRFVSSGTEATLMAFRLARAFTGKDKLLKFERHFHGWNDYAVVDETQAAPGVPAAAAGTVVVIKPEIEVVESTLRNDPDIAAVILEPTGALGSMFPLTPGFLRELREVTQRYGVVLIFDEVITGFRVSKGGAQLHYNVTPDMSTHAKIMAGGLPGGAVVGRADILDMIQHRDDSEWDTTRRVAHPGTFNANPLSASAGTTALGIIAEEPINERVDALTERLKSGLNHVLSQGETPGFAYNVCSNLFVAFGLEEELDQDGICITSHDELRQANDVKQMAHFRKALLNEGVDVQGGWSWRPTAAHSEADVDFTIEAFEKAIQAMRQEGALLSRESVSQ